MGSPQDLLTTIYLVHTVGRARKGWQDRDWYQISVYVDADSQELLQSVQRVVYRLHPTFRDPVREVSDRTTQFELSFSAWGEFNLEADVFVAGEQAPITLRRYLNF